MKRRLHFGKKGITETETIATLNSNLDMGDNSVPAIMTHGSQTRKEAVRPMTFFLDPKHITIIGTWNVRTMYQAGKTAQVAKEMSRYRLKLLGLCETRWLGAGQTTLASGEEILYSGKEEDAHHEEGVGIMMAKDTRKALLEWEAVSSRIITARFKSAARNITVINAYAPTNQADPEDKEMFYEKLQAVVNKTPNRDIRILLGDLNAKIGSDNIGREHIMGTHGLGEINDNGDRFTEFCALNDLVIGGSIFPHKETHKATWVSHDKRTENQIDHITIDKKFRRSMLDVRVKRGADAASDHHMVITKLRLKLKAANKFEQRTGVRYNTTFLKQKEKLESFRISLRNRFEALQEVDDMENQWQGIKGMFLETCEETLGKKNHTRKQWITEDTWAKIENRREKKHQRNISKTIDEKIIAETQYEEANREVKDSTRKDKRKHIEALATKAETAAQERNLKELYEITKQLAGKRNNADKPVRTKDGTALTTEESQLRRWAEHFRETLNRPLPEEIPNIPGRENVLQIRTNTPTKEEILSAIKLLKAGKAPGPDGIPPEALKADSKTTAAALHRLFTQIWEKEDIPKDWKMGHLVKIPKKGDLGNCNNWRGITLLSIASKVLTRVILERMKKQLDAELRQEQAGFRKEKSCTDQIATLRIIIEQSLEWNSPLYLNFIDFEKAFDSLDRNVIWKLLNHYGVPDKIVKIIKCMYTNFSCKVIHRGKLSPEFPVETGVKQGCLLSPLIFILAINWIMSNTVGKRNGLQWTLTTQLHDLDFADDICLLAHKFTHMQEKTNKLQNEALKLGLRVNIAKTKAIRINNRQNEILKLGEREIEEVQHFTYLGSVVSKGGGTEEDVNSRIRKARHAFIILRNIWKSSNISRNTKLKIFNSNVKSILLYGAETWRMTVNIKKKLQSFINRCLRRILNIYWPQCISNEDLWKRTHQNTVDTEILTRKWRWIGHTLRKDQQNITRHALEWNPPGTRKPGRPKQTWRRTVESELKKIDLTWKEVKKISTNRVRWKSMVSAICTANVAT